MQKEKWLVNLSVIIFCMFLVGCASPGRSFTENQQTLIQPDQTITASPVIAQTGTSETKVSEPTKMVGPQNSGRCQIGLGLREETKEFLLENADQVGLIMAANATLAEVHFVQFTGSIRVVGAPSLQVLETKALRAREADMPYEALGYGLETSASTPETEWKNIIFSTQAAAALGSEFKKQFLLAPGFKLMSENENLYPQMAENVDIWILQTQQLQKEPPGPGYRQEVGRLISLIRSGNPDISVWAQITLPPDREPDAEEWLAYRALIEDLVDGTYVGVYTWDIFEEAELLSEITTIFETVCVEQSTE